MKLYMRFFLSFYLMIPGFIVAESIKTNSKIVDITNEQLTHVIDEVTAIQGAKLTYITDSKTLKKIMIRIDFGIHFPVGECTLNNRSKDVLSEFSEILINNPLTEITIVGHTDNTSSLELNQNLSRNRAQTVADYLIAQKVQTVQLIGIVGKNYSQPVADNSTETGRAANRRVEMFIVLSPFEKWETETTVTLKDTLKLKPIPLEIKKIMEQIIKKPGKSNEVELEIDGLLVDDTKTKAGKDFYDLFYSGWEVPVSAKNYSITISEKPYRLTTTLIVISINNDIVYQDVLQPRQDMIEAQSQDAISTTQNYLANYEEITKQLNGDDMNGNGIY